MSDFVIYFNFYGEYDNFDDWDAAEERKNANKTEERHKENYTAAALNPAGVLVF